jgi:membrane-bound metal-dependent hydrolase YbcI (DUF457 family)
MIKGISSDWHLLLDYVYVPMVFAAPRLAGFENNKTAATLCKAVSAGVLGYTAITDAKGSLAKLLPYKTHALLDLASGVFSLAAPWLLGFSSNRKAKATLLAMGITGLVVGTLSYIGAEKDENLTEADRPHYH